MTPQDSSEQLEEAIEQDLSRLRIPDDERRDWFRRHLVDVCDSETRMREDPHRPKPLRCE